jgi:hypothetical protein
MQPVDVIIDIKTSDLTLSQVLAVVDEYKRAHPDLDVFVDGDLYQVVSRRRFDSKPDSSRRSI